MGIFDLLRDLFPVPQRNEGKLGPNDLPEDVLNDLRRNQHHDSNAPPHPSPHHHGDDMDEQHLHDDHSQHFHGNRSYHSFHDNSDEEFEDAFREMDDMFKSFFGGGFGGFGRFGGGYDENGHIQPPLPPLIGNTDQEEEPKSLRDKMLDGGEHSDGVQHFHYHDNNPKDHHSHGSTFQFRTPFSDFFDGPFRDFFDGPFRDVFRSPFGRHEKSPFGHGGQFGYQREPPFDGPDGYSSDGNPRQVEDQDLDNSPNKPDVEDLLASPPNRPDRSDRSLFRFPDNSPSMGGSFSAYSSVSKKMNPDGSVETTSRKRDSDGNEEVTVSRHIGEQTHSVTTKKNREGEEEKVENFVNMDEKDLQEFEGKWKGAGNSSASTPRDKLAGPAWWKPKL